MSTPKNVVDELLKGNMNFSESGWQGFENAAALTAEQQQAQGLRRYQRAVEIAKPFMSPAGRLCLQRLHEQTTQAPTWIDGSGLLNGIATGFAREGQNSLVRYIEEQIKIAEEGPPAAAKGGKK